MESPINYFKSLVEPRMERCKLHLFDEIIFLTIAALISGAVPMHRDCRDRMVWEQEKGLAVNIFKV